MNEKINCGSEELIPKSEWVTPQDLEGELKVLNSPLMEKAFQKILTKFIPTHNVAFLSLCTATRPYSKSRKWNVYNNYFGDKCDLIVTSNGGVIPQPFWECYPYMTYDAYSHEDNGLYNKVLLRRLVEFFTKFDSYDTIIFNFRPGLRNRAVAEDFEKLDIAKKFNIIITPSEDAYGTDKKLGFPNGSMFPDLNHYSFEDIKKSVGVVEYSKSDLW